MYRLGQKGLSRFFHVLPQAQARVLSRAFFLNLPFATMRLPFPLFLTTTLLLAACQPSSGPTDAGAAPPPWVRTAGLGVDQASTELGLSGTVRARVESPLAFQVSGRIARRLVDAGQTVKMGQTLFELDKRDLEQSVLATQADVAAADAALATTEAELARQRQLHSQQFISAQALERAQLARREAQTRREAAATRLVQAQHALGYAYLIAPQAGVLMDVVGETGQVVGTGQPVALLAQAGEREVEVHFPDGTTPPARGTALTDSGTEWPLQLREVAGAVDAQSRTRRARYSVQTSVSASGPVLGTVLRTRFATVTTTSHSNAGAASASTIWRVPVGAIDERAQGPRVWQVQAQGQQIHVVPVPVKVLELNGDNARIQTELPAQARVVALGTHLLTPNMLVRELPR